MVPEEILVTSDALGAAAAGDMRGAHSAVAHHIPWNPGEDEAHARFAAALTSLQEGAFALQRALHSPGDEHDKDWGSPLRQQRFEIIERLGPMDRANALQIAREGVAAGTSAASLLLDEEGPPDQIVDVMTRGLLDMRGGGWVDACCALHRVHDAVEHTRWLLTDGREGERGLSVLVSEWGAYPPSGFWPDDDEDEDE